MRHKLQQFFLKIALGSSEFFSLVDANLQLFHLVQQIMKNLEGFCIAIGTKVPKLCKKKFPVIMLANFLHLQTSCVWFWKIFFFRVKDCPLSSKLWQLNTEINRDVNVDVVPGSQTACWKTELPHALWSLLTTMVQATCTWNQCWYTTFTA